MVTFIQRVKNIQYQNQSLTEFMQLIQLNEEGKPKNIFTAFDAEIAVGDWKIIRSQHKVTQFLK